MAEKKSRESKDKKLEKFKKNYEIIRAKNGLPSFEELNEDFQIERGADVETDYLIREVRRFLADKFSNYMRFTEALLNPTNAPMFIFSLVKTLSSKDREILGDVYKKLAAMEVDLIELDLRYSEEKEIEFIKNSFKEWQLMKESLIEVLKSIRSNWGSKTESSKKDYFG